MLFAADDMHGNTGVFNLGYTVCCPNGFDACSGSCVDLTRDSNNWGSFGTTCSAPYADAMICRSGQCITDICQIGYGDCKSIAADGCEADLTSRLVCISSGPSVRSLQESGGDFSRQSYTVFGKKNSYP
jgi:hypothetical protein